MVRVNNTLYPNVIRSVGELHTRPDLEKLAIEFLCDADPGGVIDAATIFPGNTEYSTQMLFGEYYPQVYINRLTRGRLEGYLDGRSGEDEA